jgi:hypothetical protein
METFLIILLYIIPLLGCIGIALYIIIYEKDYESIVIMILILLSIIPITNLVLPFLIIGAHLIDKLRKK